MISSTSALLQPLPEAIRLYCGTPNYQRGLEYFQAGYIYGPERHGRVLRSFCRGTSIPSYRPEVLLGHTSILSSRCTCPAHAYDGPCKHVAALLLAWYYKPDEFDVRPALSTILANWTKRDLLDFIDKIVTLHPDLDDKLFALAQPRRITQEDYDTRIAEIFRWRWDLYEAEFRSDPTSEIAHQLNEYFELAKTLVEQEAFTQALSLYSSLIKKIVKNYLSFEREGQLDDIFRDIIHTLYVLFNTSSQDSPVRLAILDIFLEALKSPSYDLGIIESIEEFILSMTTNKERSMLVPKLRSELTITNKELRKRYGGLLLELEGDALSPEQFKELCLFCGFMHELVKYLLTHNRLQEALQIINDQKNPIFLDLITLLMRFKYTQEARDSAHNRLAEEKDKFARLELAAWLRDFYAQQQDWRLAYRFGIRVFRAKPNFFEYTILRDVGHHLRQWQKTKATIINFLIKKKKYSEVVKIYCDEREFAKLFEFADAISWTALDPDLRRSVVQIAQDSYPLRAIELYKVFVEEAIARRTRVSYQEAAADMLSIKQLMAAQGKLDEWQTYAQDIKQRYRLRRALRAELGALDI